MENSMETTNKLKEFFKENFMADLDDGFSNDDSFLENGIIDSTGVLELILFLEENFSIKILDDEIIPDNLDSINNLIAFIGNKQNTTN
jgi:acyl carrier protein